MANADMAAWKYRLTTLGLLLAYAPSFDVPLWIRKSQLEIVMLRADGWPYCGYTLISFALVTAALFLSVLGPRVVRDRPLTVVRIFLLINWLPHSFCALAATSIHYPGAWID